MLIAMIVILFLLIALAGALTSGPGRDLISRRPYNNQYSDASAARDDHF